MVRKSSEILSVQMKNIPDRMKILNSMRNQAKTAVECLCSGDLTSFGKLLHKGWLLKKQLAHNISNPLINMYYKHAREAGALGG